MSVPPLFTAALLTSAEGKTTHEYMDGWINTV